MSLLATEIPHFIHHLNQLPMAHAVQLIAVSKTQSAESMREAFHCGLRKFGENYVQEALDKQSQLSDLPIEWHFIGPLQSNKTKPVAEHFSWVHSVDRLKLAERLSAQRPPELSSLQLCIQVNVSGEHSKSGIAPEETLALAQAIQSLPRVQLRGLMAIPEPTQDLDLLRSRFADLRKLQSQLVKQGIPLDTLSMGMSADYALAIQEGATMIRVGSALFGQRHSKLPV